MAADNLVQRLWSKVPSVDCKGLCWQSCGPVVPSLDEAKVIRARRNVEVTWDKATLTCNLLDTDHRCTIYDDRPLLCRLWGAVPDMPCPHGCEQTLTSEGGKALMRGIYGLDRHRWPKPPQIT